MKATKVVAGQIRDVASGPELKRGIHRYARVDVVHANTGVAYITNLKGGNKRAKDLSQLARCRVVEPDEVAS